MDRAHVIDRPGIYLTRKGERVRIDAIEGGSSFPCKGYVLRFDSLGRRKTRGCFNTWQTSGVKNMLPGSGLDIVSYVSA